MLAHFVAKQTHLVLTGKDTGLAILVARHAQPVRTKPDAVDGYD